MMGTLDKSTVKRAANNIDVAVGEKIRLRRRALGLSQTNLAQKLGISFQQFQKHEKGKNRIGASRLSLIAQALDVSVGFFFDEAEPERADAISSFSATSDLTGFVLSPVLTPTGAASRFWRRMTWVALRFAMPITSGSPLLR